MLTNKVGIIQGPPGAGKTYLGTKLTEILLNLEKPSTRPIVVITYKNHALDEFLKGLLENGICSLDEMCRSSNVDLQIMKISLKELSLHATYSDFLITKPYPLL